MTRALPPTIGLLLLSAFYSLLAGWEVYRGSYVDEVDLLYNIGLSLSLAWWVYVDRRRQGYPAVFEFEAFVFFGWPLVVPYYLVRTRGWLRGAVISLLGGLAVCLPAITSSLVYLLYW